MRQIRGQRRKKRQKDSENRHVARAERSRARRSGFLLFRPSVRLFPFFLSFPIFSLFCFGQSVSLSLSPRFSLSLLRLSPGSLRGLPSRGTPSTDDEVIDYSKKEHTTSRRLLLLEPEADCDPTTLARPEERKLPGPESRLGCHLLPTPGVWSMKIFSAPPSLLALLVDRPRRSSHPSLLPPARFQPHTSIRGSLARML